MGALVAVLLVTSPADGSIVEGLELKELVRHADRIVLGRVLFSESFQRPDGQFGTWHRIGVEREIRGHAPDEQEVIIETMGGQIGDLAMRVEGEPSFTVGERVLVFIRDGGPYTAFRPVGMGQGVMRVRREQGVETVTQNREGLMLVRRNAQGRLERTLGALPERERLDALLSKLRAGPCLGLLPHEGRECPTNRRRALPHRGRALVLEERMPVLCDRRPRFELDGLCRCPGRGRSVIRDLAGGRLRRRDYAELDLRAVATIHVQATGVQQERRPQREHHCLPRPLERPLLGPGQAGLLSICVRGDDRLAQHGHR
jgi:hypothetical protein